MTCTYCADTGWSSIGMMCRCPIGANLRTQANRAAVGIVASGTFPDDDLTHEDLAERLSKTPPPIDRIPTPDHYVCSTIGCSNRVSAEDRKCWDCQAEDGAPAYDPTSDRLAIFLYGIALGIGATLIVLRLSGGHL